MPKGLFIAIPVEPNYAYELRLQAQELWRDHPHISWMNPEDVHLTLSYINVAEHSRKRIRQIAKGMNNVVTRLVEHYRPFPITLDQFAWFGPQNNILVLTNPQPTSNQRLKELAKAISRKLLQRYVHCSAQWAFNPHVSLGSFDPRNPKAANILFAVQPTQNVLLRFQVDTIHICQSTPTPCHHATLYQIPIPLPEKT